MPAEIRKCYALFVRVSVIRNVFFVAAMLRVLTLNYANIPAIAFQINKIAAPLAIYL